MKNKHLRQLTKVVVAVIFCLYGSLLLHATGDSNDPKGVDGPISVADPDIDNKKQETAKAMEEQSVGPQQVTPFANEKNFVYSTNRSKWETFPIYNYETLGDHSYITAAGYLMEYLGVNARNGNYYDVRFQGGIYAIKKSDVTRFIPLSQARTFPYYENQGGDVVHHIEDNPLAGNSWYLTTRLGKAPGWMQPGRKYYSFSGIYFTDAPEKLGNYNPKQNAVNANDPYYDYYLYQPLRTKTAYSADEINRAFNQIVKNEHTQMTNTGQNFIDSQNTYGVNALLMFAMGMHESENGKSNFAKDRNNLFGIDAFDTNTDAAAWFPSIANGIEEQGNFLSWVHGDPHTQNGHNYYGANLGNKSSGMNVKYASDPYWGEKIANHYAIIDRMYGQRDYNKYGLAIVHQGTQVTWNHDGGKPAHRYKPSTSALTYMYPVIYFDDNRWAKVMMEAPYSQQWQINRRYDGNGRTLGGRYYNWQGYINANDMIKVNRPKAADEIVETEGNLTYYINIADKTLKRTEERNAAGQVVKIYEYYPKTVYKQDHGKHIQHIFNIDNYGNIKNAVHAKDNTHGGALDVAYEFYPGTRYGNNHYSHVQLIFDLKNNGEISKAVSYKDHTSGVNALNGYEYYPGTKYGQDHGKHIKMIYDLRENGGVIRSSLYKDNTYASARTNVYEYYADAYMGQNPQSKVLHDFVMQPNGEIRQAFGYLQNGNQNRVYEFYPGTKYGNNHYTHVANIFDVTSTGEILFASNYRDNMAGTGGGFRYEYYEGTKYGENHYSHVKNIYEVNDRDVLYRSKTYKDNSSATALTHVYEYYDNARFRQGQDQHIQHMFEIDNKGEIKQAFSYQNNKGTAGLYKAYQFYPGAKYGNNHYSHVKDIYDLKANGEVTKLISYKDNSAGTQQTNVYEYHAGAMYGPDHKKHVQFKFDIADNGTIRQAYHYEDNNDGTKPTEAYEFYGNTRYGAEHGYHIQYTYYLNEDNTIKYAEARRNNQLDPYEKLYFRQNTKYGDDHRNKIIRRERLKAEGFFSWISSLW